MNLIVGTAGHIDHGKSSLVLALTGTDPDRLKEEKARGITIELGFAHTTEQGVTLSFVDVPGHERFVKNMLAGVGGIDLVMLVVAADESVMPQTREHFEICRLLHVPRGIVAITKADLADADTIELVRLEVRDLVRGSFLEPAPVLAVSARSGAGVPELRAALAAAGGSTGARQVGGAPRLPVDRVFSMKGFGTVVTGTLGSGRIGVDDELVLLPPARAVKVRGVHVHGSRQEAAVAGQRAAVNLGGVEVADVQRGETLTRRGTLSTTRRLDATIELLSTAKPLRHGARVRFHQGTSEVLGRVAVSGASADVQPGARADIRIRLESAAVLTRGDRFILRAYSPPATIAGGTVLDPSPPRTGIRTSAGRARFARLRESGDEPLHQFIAEAGIEGITDAVLVSRGGLREDEASAAAARLQQQRTAARAGAVLVSVESLAAAQRALLAALAEYHRQHPLVEGLPREEARERFFSRAPQSVFDLAVAELAAGKKIVARDRLALASHTLALSDEEMRARDIIERSYREAGLKPLDLESIAAQSGVKGDIAQRVTALLVRQKVLARVDDLLFHEESLTRLKDDVKALRGGDQPATIDVAAFKDRFGVTRKFAIPLLEYLDRERVTRRVGDTRQIISS